MYLKELGLKAVGPGDEYMVNLKLRVGVAGLLAAMAGSTWAAPAVTSVTGTVGQNQTITVNGSSFGSKAKAAPLVFDDFEGGTVGAKVQSQPAAYGSWAQGDWSYAVTYASTSPLQGSKVARHAFTPTDYNASLYVNPQATQSLYMDFWMRAVPKGSLSRNWKPWRLHNSSDADIANDVVFCDSPGWVGLASGGSAWVKRARPFGQWEHFQVAVKLGSNGLFSQLRDGEPDVSVTGVNNSGSISQVRIGHYWGADADANCGSNPGADVYTDVVYVDNTLSRVVIGDAASLAASRNTAIQIPTAWSGDQISVKVNTTRFASGAKAYLFVVDSNNVASVGYPITIGASGGVLPNPPTGVSVN